MKVATRTLLIAFLLVVAITPRAHATCQPDESLSPTVYEEILFDTKFNGNCVDWVKTGSATRLQFGSDWEIEFDGTGTLTQTQVAGTYTDHMEMAFQLTVVSGTPGTERLKLQIVQGNTVMEEVRELSPSSTSTTYYDDLDNYSDEAFSVRFKFEPGASPGTTKFRVDNVQVWGFF
jgi:hypothetical protein